MWSIQLDKIGWVLPGFQQIHPVLHQFHYSRCSHYYFMTAVISTLSGSCAYEFNDHKNEENEFFYDWRFYLVILSLSIITLAAAIDATSLSVALPIIASDLHGSAIEAFWAGTSFLLSSTVVMPSYGSLSHIFGRKPLLLAALFFFAIGAIISAIANNFTTILVGRSCQGIGAGGIISLTEIIITDLVPLYERGKWYGLISAVWAVGSVSGPIIGGYFSQDVSWKWVFWINLPIIGLGLICVILFLKQHMSKQESFINQLRRVDWFGTVLFIGATTSLLIPVTWGGVMYPWSSSHTLIPFIIGLLGLVVFGLYEYFICKEAMVRLSIFSNPTSCIVYFQTFIHGIVLWSLLYYGPFFFEGVRGFSPIISGIAMFPETFTIAPVAAVIGVIVSIVGKYRWALWSGWTLTCLGFGLLYIEDERTPNLVWVPLNLVPGLGMGMLFTSMAMAIPAACRPVDMAHAVAFFTFFRVFGNCVGVAVSGAVFENQMKHNLDKDSFPAGTANDFSQNAAALVEIMKFMERGPVRDQLVRAYAESLKIVWIAMSALAGMALISNIWVKSFTLQQSLVTEQRFLHKKKLKDAEKSLKSYKTAVASKESLCDPIYDDKRSSHGDICVNNLCSKASDNLNTVNFQNDEAKKDKEEITQEKKIK